MADMEMDEGQPLSDSDIATGSLCYPAVAAAAAGEPLPAAEVAALSRLSEQLGTLRRGAPGLAFCADASITVRSSLGDPPREVLVHRCVLSVRSPFFREKFAAGEAALDLGELVVGFQVGHEALEAVLEYIYTSRLGEFPRGVVECVDETRCCHEACWPAVHFMLQVLYAAFTFEIYELVRLFQRRLLHILERVATDDILLILIVANLCNKHCQKLLIKCIEMVGKSDVDYITLERKLPSDVFFYNKLPSDIVMQIVNFRSNLGLDGEKSLRCPDKHVKKIYGALDTDDIELVQLFLNNNPTTLDDAKALHYAVACCDWKVSKQLLDRELVDVNGRDHRNYTALHIAARRTKPEIIMSLLTKGAQPSDTTSDGRTALQISKRLTRSKDYFRSVETGKTTPREGVCIEILERADKKDSLTEVTSVPAEMTSDNPHEKLSYLESRVWLAECLFPAEAKTAMNNADMDGNLKFKSSSLPQLCTGNKRTADDVVKTSLRMTEEFLHRMKALSKTVELGMRYFPRCSKEVNRILDEGI